MKTLKLLLILILILGLILLSCEPEPEIVNKSCLCTIEGKKYFSNDGIVWNLTEIDARTGMLFPCWYDNLETNQEITDSGTKYKTVWKCRD